MMNLHHHINFAENGFDDLKAVLLDFKTKDIRVKRFDDEELETLLNEGWCQTQKEFAKALLVTQQSISKQAMLRHTSKSKAIWSRTNWKREISKDDLACCLNSTKRNLFCIESLPETKTRSLRQLETQKIVCKAPWTSMPIVLS